MNARSSNPAAERRRFQRFPVVHGMVEPITIDFDEPKPGKAAGLGKPSSASSRRALTPGAAAAPAAAPRNQPAILTNLSAGGMSLILFLEPPRTKRLEMVLSIPGLTRIPIEGRVVRINEKGQTYNVGIAFTKIGKKHRDRISGMAQDHIDCETRISLKLPEVCVQTCSFHALCAKPQKGPYWK